MHELPVTESILEISLRHGRESNAKRITDLYLVIGQLASIVDDSVVFYWDIISKGTLAEGAQLHFKRIPAEMQCRDCKSRFKLSSEEFSCPECGGAHIYVVAGEEFYLDSIDIEN